MTYTLRVSRLTTALELPSNGLWSWVLGLLERCGPPKKSKDQSPKAKGQIPRKEVPGNGT